MSNTFSSSDITGFFLSDANEHLQTINDDLLDLEQNQNDLTLVDKTFRAIHAIKGSAGMSGFYVVSQLAHRIEDLLSKLREHELQVSNDVIDLLFQGVDNLTRQIDNISNGQPEEESALQLIVELYADILGTSDLPQSPPKKSAPAPASKPATGKANAPKQTDPTTKPAAKPTTPSPTLAKTTLTAKPAQPQTKPPQPKQPPLQATVQTKPTQPVVSPTSANAPKPNISETDLAERYIREDQIDQAVVIYRNLLRKTPNNKSVRQRLEETIALQAYLKENPA
jgi:chemotaxis protein histidine kinase CheA